MSYIEKLSNYIALQLARPLGIGEDQQEVVAYGAFILLQSAWSLLLNIILGVIFNLILEMLTISLVATILKKYSGGAHATSPNRCAVLGGIVFLVLSVIEVKIMGVGNTNLMVLGLIGIVFAYLSVSRYAPVDSPNKPINELQMKEYLNKRSKLVVVLGLISIIILWTIYFYTLNNILLRGAIGVLIGLSWQAFTLLPIGSYLINTLDRLLGVVIP